MMELSCQAGVPIVPRRTNKQTDKKNHTKNSSKKINRKPFDTQDKRKAAGAKRSMLHKLRRLRNTLPPGKLCKARGSYIHSYIHISLYFWRYLLSVSFVPIMGQAPRHCTGPPVEDEDEAAAARKTGCHWPHPHREKFVAKISR